MKVNRRELASSVFWLALSIFVCVLSIKIGIGSPRSPGSGLFIFLSSLVMGLLSIILGVLALRTTGTRQGIIELWKGMRWGKVLLLVVSLLAYALLLPDLGFIITTFVVMTFLFLLTGIERLWVCIGIALATAIASYVLFDVFLRVPLPRGILDLVIS